LLLIPVGCWMAYMVYRVRAGILPEFKPRVVGLMMDFIDNDFPFR
jgi:hypothetical protein